MDQSTYVSPRIGTKTVIAAAASILVILLIQHQTTGFHNIRFALTGAVYGLIAWACWLMTLVPGLLMRSVARLIIALIGSYILLLQGVENVWIRYVVHVGGLMMTQSAIFWWLGIPVWRRSTTPPDPQKPQFSIAQILISTTGIALLLGLAIHYRRPVAAVGYWLGLTGIWVFFPLISAGAGMATLTRRFSSSIAYALGTILMAAGVAMGLAFAEISINNLHESVHRLIVLSYGLIVLGFLVMVSILSLAGRLDGSKASNR